MSDMHGWRSWHLHVGTAEPAHTEGVVTDVLGPLSTRFGLSEQDGPPWFFLRYWQRGPHVRVRIHGLADIEADAVEAELAGRLRELDASVPESQRLNQDAYAHTVRALASAGEGGGPLDAGDLLPPGVHRAEYEPEYERYGGEGLTALSEDLFHHSSRVALRVCQARTGRRHALYSGMEAAAAVCSLLTDPAEFLVAQRDFWLTWARAEQLTAEQSGAARRALATTVGKLRSSLGELELQLLSILRHGDPRWAEWTRPLGAALLTWTDQFGPGRASSILGSHIHMTSNRLGVGAGREAYIAQLLLSLLDSENDEHGESEDKSE